MVEYTYEDIIMDPEDPRLEGAIGKECYFSDCPKKLLDAARYNSALYLDCLTDISKKDACPFADKKRYDWTLIIIKKEEPKPKPKYIPFENITEFLDAHKNLEGCLNEEAYCLSKNGIWLKDKDIDSVFYVVTEIWRDGVVLGSDQSTTKWDDLLYGYTFIDGSPCGMKTS